MQQLNLPARADEDIISQYRLGICGTKFLCSNLRTTQSMTIYYSFRRSWQNEHFGGFPNSITSRNNLCEDRYLREMAKIIGTVYSTSLSLLNNTFVHSFPVGFHCNALHVRMSDNNLKYDWTKCEPIERKDVSRLHINCTANNICIACVSLSFHVAIRKLL